MNIFLLWLLIGLGIGIPVFFIGLFFYKLMKNTMERRTIKKAINEGKFLTPIDPKDYDTNAWKDKIDVNKTAEDLKNFDKKIFNKTTIEVDESVVIPKAKAYLIKCRELGYSDRDIAEEFKKKNYSLELISKIFEEGQ